MNWYYMKVCVECYDRGLKYDSSTIQFSDTVIRELIEDARRNEAEAFQV